MTIFKALFVLMARPCTWRGVSAARRLTCTITSGFRPVGPSALKRTTLIINIVNMFTKKDNDEDQEKDLVFATVHQAVFNVKCQTSHVECPMYLTKRPT